MTILCGTDFSELAARAASVAAALAARSEQPLRLVHVLGFSAKALHDSAKRAQLESAERKLRDEASRLQTRGAKVETQVLFGELAEALVAGAYETHAALLIIGAHGRADASSRHVGSGVESVVTRAGVPVLVVREEEHFLAWASGSRPLRIILGADASATTDAAVDLVKRLRALGPCDVSAVHLFWPPQEFQRLGFGGARSFLDIDADVQRAIRDELAQRLDGMYVQVEPHIGNLGDRLSQLATESRADLIVVGTHGRAVADRVIRGSISHDVLRTANVSVACVPATAAGHQPAGFQRALVATDFSELGNAAFALARAAVPDTGTLHVVHVVPPRKTGMLEPSDIFAPEEGATKAFSESAERLRRLVESQATLSAHNIVVHVLESNQPAEALAQAAERLRVDVICMGTRGRGAITRAVLGSVAQGVLSETRRPVLLAQAPRD
ncbi:MAG: universal stress protein [Polyangiales bacterium]